MHTNKEQKIIRLFMIVLGLAIVMVYILLFQVKSKTLKSSQPSNTSGTAIQISILSGEEEQTLTPINGQWEELSGTTGIDTSSSFTTGTSTTGSTANKTGKTISSTGAIKILSGTSIFYGSIESIEKLGIRYAYALVDSKNIYYINLGSPSYDFASIARKLNGNLYELKTETEIAQNKLFGEKIVFINIPEYKDNKVLFLLYIGDETRLLQMDYATYHKSKSYIKSLFIQ